MVRITPGQAECGKMKAFGFLISIIFSAMDYSRISKTIGLLLVLLISRTAFAATESDLSILSSDVTGLTIEYRPNFDQPEEINRDGTSYQRWSVQYTSDVATLSPGMPRLLVRTIPIAFPGLYAHKVEIISADYEDVSGVFLAPVPFVNPDLETYEASYVVDPQKYTSSEWLPSRTEFIDPAVNRGRAMGQVKIAPFQYNASARTLRKFTRIVVRVEFGPAEFSPQVGSADQLMENIAANSDAARGWHISEPRPAWITPRNSVFAPGSSWWRFGLTESGMYKLSGTALLAAGIPPSTNPGRIGIFSNGGKEPSTDPLIYYPPDVQEIAVFVYDDTTNPGQLDQDDYIIFYGQAHRGWGYSANTRSFNHYVNLFANEATYWVTYSNTTQSKRMAPMASPGGSATFVPATVLGKVFREDERVNVQNSGRQWLGQSFNPGDVIEYRFPLAGFDSTRPISYRLSLGGRNAQSPSTFEVYEHGALLSSFYFRSINTTGGGYFDSYVVMDTRTVRPAANNFGEAQSVLQFKYISGATGIGYLDWLEIFYDRYLRADADLFNFHSQDTTADALYSVTGFSQAAVMGFDVTRFDSVLRIESSSIGRFDLRTSLSLGDVREFYLVGTNGFKTPPPMQSFVNQNLHGDTTAADLVIISHRDFMTAAQRLKTHREKPGPNRLNTRLVDVGLIYNEFSGGQPSPIGIRNYLRYLYYTMTERPKYVLLMGDGDHDYRRIAVPGTNWIPPWETLESFAGLPLSSFATEDSIAMVTGTRTSNFSIGRLPVRSLQHANDVVSKIIEYETSISPDPWKLRVTFLGDDALTTDPFPDGTIHSAQAESISNLVPPLFEKQKIYIAEYPTVVTSVGRRKPTVNTALVNMLNRGTLMINFTGHGNPRVWTHEQVFVRENDFPRLTNRGKYFLVVAATCNWSQFDHPSDQSGGEQILLIPNAGAIATLSATRAVFSGDNYALNVTFYQKLFGVVDSLGRIRGSRLGDAFFLTKQIHYSGFYWNDQKFVLLGDPSLRFGFPRQYAFIDSINGRSGDSTTQIQALGRVSLKAQVRDTALAPTTFSGSALVTVYDSDRRVIIHKPEESFTNFQYSASGGVLFRGQSRVNNGRIGSNFVVPADISYQEGRGRISTYFYNDDNDGAGVSRNIIVRGTNPNPTPDSIGPTIFIFLQDRGFRSGDLVGENPQLIVDLHDENGINTSGTGLGHQLEAWLNDNPEGIVLSDYYRSKPDSFQAGTIQYQLTGLAPGRHRLRLRAWDTYNNPAVAEVDFDVLTKVGLQLTNVYNYPNPFSSETVFTFEQNSITPVDAEVKIYTVAGRLIASLKGNGLTGSFLRIPWDGRDNDGDQLANGVYLYKVIVRTPDGRFASEALGKMTRLR